MYSSSGKTFLKVIEYHVLKLSFGWILTERAHNSAQLFGGDGSIAVLVEQGERLLELSYLFFGKLVGHCCSFVR